MFPSAPPPALLVGIRIDESRGLMMSRLFAAAVAGLALILPGAWASSGWAGTLERIRESGTFKIGFRTDAPPYSYKNTIGEPAGYTVALCRAVASQIRDQLKLTSMSVTYVPVSAESRFKEVDDGSIDLLCGATTMTLGRRELVDFSLPVFIDGAGVLLAQDGPKGFSDLAGKKVGVRAGTTTEEALRNTLRAASVNAEAIAVPDHRDGIAKLISGEIAAYFADRAILFFLMIDSAAASKLRLADDMLTYETYALALKKGDQEFRLAVDRALSRLYRSGAIMEVFKSSLGSQTDPTPELTTLYRINAMPE